MLGSFRYTQPSLERPLAVGRSIRLGDPFAKPDLCACFMGLITRHIVSETLKQLALAVVTLTAVLSISMAAKEAVRIGMPPMLVMQTMPYFVLEMIGYSLPAAMLYTVCSVFGRLAGDNEIVALRSMGISPWRIVEPVLVVAFLLSLAAVVSYDYAATWGRPGIKHLLADSAVDVAVGVLRTQRSVDLPWGSVSVRRLDGDVLVQPTIRLKQSDNRPETQLNAAIGKLEGDAEGMRLVLYDSSGEVGNDDGRFSHPGHYEIPLPNLDQARPIHRDWLAIREIQPHIDNFQRRINATQQELNQVADKQQRAELQALISSLNWKIDRLSAEPHRRWANGFSCIAFTLVGIPLAVLRGSSSALSTFFMAFMPILLVFYPLLMTSETLALSGYCPPWSFWFADAVLAIAGGLLIKKAVGN